MMKNKNLISISGKKGSGKDTVGKIIQLLANNYKVNEIVSLINNNVTIPNGGWHIKKWAGAVKEICAIILGVPVSGFEDQEFKASELSEEWWSWNIIFGLKPVFKYNTKEEARQHIIDADKRVSCFEELRPSQVLRIEQFKPTVRWLLQNIGTEVGRTIHPNMWVNVLMNEYGDGLDSFYDKINDVSGCVNLKQWIITDTRFENELKAIQDKEGICVKVESEFYRIDNHLTRRVFPEGGEHPSETSLDHVKEWDWIFHNNGSIEDLVEQVKEFLKHFKII